MPRRSKGISASAFQKRSLRFSDKDFYSPTDLRHIDDRAMRKEYTELRDIAQKRLKRLLKEDPDNRTAMYHPKGFPKLKDIKSTAQLRNALSDLSRFINTESSTVYGQHKQNKAREKILLERGYLSGDESAKEKKYLMRFVNYIQDTLHENVMYSSKWGHKIRDDRFKDMIRRGRYGEAYDDLKNDTTTGWSEKDEEVRKAAEAQSEEIARQIEKYYGTKAKTGEIRRLETESTIDQVPDLIEADNIYKLLTSGDFDEDWF